MAVDLERWRRHLERDRTVDGRFEASAGIYIDHIGEFVGEGHMDVTRKVTNPMGFGHGGAVVGLADTVAGCAACSDGLYTVTADCDFHFLRAAMGPTLYCKATPEKVGRTLRVIRAEVTDSAGKMVAVGTFTFFMSERKGEEEEKA